MSPSEDHLSPNEIAALWCTILASGPLSPEEAERFTRWINADPTNMTIFGKTLAIWRALEISDLPESVDITQLRQSPLADMRQSSPGVAVSRGFDRRMIIKSAAAVVGVLTGAGLLLSQRPAQFQTTTTPQGAIPLSDGSVLSLDADTLVKVKYSLSERRLWLRKGRAKFIVSKDPRRPFSVDVDGRTVVATGTQFVVEKIDGQVRISLFEGHLAIFQPGNAPARGGRADYVLSAGQGLVFDGPNFAATPIDLPGEDQFAWEQGRLVFKDEPLKIAAVRVNRYSAEKIQLSPGVDGTIKVSGIYKSGDTQAFLEGVSALNGLRYRRDRDGYVIEAAKP